MFNNTEIVYLKISQNILKYVKIVKFLLLFREMSQINKHQHLKFPCINLHRTVQEIQKHIQKWWMRPQFFSKFA